MGREEIKNHLPERKVGFSRFWGAANRKPRLDRCTIWFVLYHMVTFEQRYLSRIEKLKIAVRSGWAQPPICTIWNIFLYQMDKAMVNH